MNPPSIPFVKGRPYTLIAISSMLAHTTKDEVVITSVLDTPTFRPRYANSTAGAWRMASYKHNGKRKEYYLDIEPGTLVFAGHGVVLVDSDVAQSADGDSGFYGNACYNLCGTPEQIRALIIEKNLNPDFSDLGSVLVIPPADEARTWYDRSKETQPFMDESIQQEILQRMRERMSQPSNITPFPSPKSEINNPQSSIDNPSSPLPSAFAGF